MVEVKPKELEEQTNQEIPKKVNAEAKTSKEWLKNYKEPKSKGVVTERDRIACRWVCEQGAMTIEQLWRAVWWSENSNSPRYAYVRVLFLERSGFLEKIRSPYSLKSFYKATRTGQEAAQSDLTTQTPVPLQSPPISQIPHSDLLTELRLLVTRAGKVKNWKTDRVLVLDPTFPRERFYSHVPDAIWTTPSGKRVAIEYERTRKGIFRIRQKIEAFSREMLRPDRAFDQVLWIGAPGGVTADLERVLATHPNQILRSYENFKSEILLPPLHSPTPSDAVTKRRVDAHADGS